MENIWENLARSTLKTYIFALAVLALTCVTMLAAGNPFAAGIAFGAILCLSLDRLPLYRRLRRTADFHTSLTADIDQLVVIQMIQTREEGHDES